MMPRRNMPLLFAAVLLLAPAASRAEDPASKQKGSFMPITGLAATVMRPGGGHGVMTVEAGLDVPDPALHHLADLSQPRLQDAFTRVLQGYAGGLTPGRPPDADYVARQLQAATDEVLGRRGARLLLGGLMVN